MTKAEFDKIPAWIKAGDDWPNESCEAATVGQLKQLLDRLPDALPVHCGLGGFVTLVVEGGARDCYLNFENCD